jgi:hypothetical protein
VKFIGIVDRENRIVDVARAVSLEANAVASGEWIIYVRLDYPLEAVGRRGAGSGFPAR